MDERFWKLREKMYNPDLMGVTRRELLIGGGLTLGLIWLSLKDSASPPPIPTISRAEGKNIPGAYSEAISRAGLIPREFSGNQGWKERIQQTVGYLERYHTYLKDKPELRGKPLSALGVTAANNYPIAIEEGWTSWHVVDQLLKQLKDRKTTFDYNTEKTHLAELQTGITTDNDGNIRHESEVVFEDILMAEPSFQEQGWTYAGISDAEAAVLAMHEFAHDLQGEAIFRIVTKDQNLRFTIPEQAWRAMERLEPLLPQEAHNQHERVKKEAFQAELLPDIAPRVQVAEAQANTVAYAFLLSLNQLNRSRNFPGTRLTDPYPETVAVFQPTNPGYINLYEKFLETVVPSGNALHPEWLRYAAPAT